MKHLHLLRHGDAVKGSVELSDHERPLSDKGRAEIARQGAWMKNSGLVVDTVLCSTARRTRETLEALGLDASATSVFYTDALYLASPGDMLHVIQHAPASAKHLLVIGHNPGMHGFCTLFAAEGNPEIQEAVSLRYPTGALATLRFDVADWTDVPGDGGALERFREAGE